MYELPKIRMVPKCPAPLQYLCNEKLILMKFGTVMRSDAYGPSEHRQPIKFCKFNNLR